MAIEETHSSVEFESFNRGEERISDFGRIEQTEPVLIAQNNAAGSSELAPVDAGASAAQAGTAPQGTGQAASLELVPDAQNTVQLPAGTSIENAQLVGRDLILKQPDGSEIVIKNAAANVPSFIIDQVAIPQEALIAALEANGINVAAGPNGSLVAGPGNLQGSGGNFSTPIPGIGNADAILDLLPPTALRFPELERRELFPFGRRPNRPVNVNGENESVLENDLSNGSSPKSGRSTANRPD